MGYRRQQRADCRDDEVTRRPAPPTVLQSGSRLGSKSRGGVRSLYILLVVAAACTNVPLSTPSVSERTELLVGIPEARAAVEESGINQVASLLTFESLTENGIDGRPRPRLAQRWTWENDDLALRMFLRGDVVLHDGRPLTAEIALDLVRRAVALPSNIARYSSLSDIRQIRSDGDLQLVFDLVRPSAMLPGDLTVPLNVKAENMGTGAYRVVTREAEQIVLEAWNQYYLGQPSISRVVLRAFPTLRTTWATLLRGELDVVYDVPADAVEFIRNDDVRVVSVPRWYQFLVAFNSQHGPLRSARVRKALNMAVDREALLSTVLNGRGSPSTGPVWPRYWAYDEAVPGFQFDPQGAGELLDAAGFPLPDQSDDPQRPPARLRFTCLIPENFSVWERLALVVQRDLFNIGIDMQFKVVPFTEFNALIGRGDFEALIIDLISGPTAERPYLFWGAGRTPGAPRNPFGYENADAERAFEVLRTSTNDTAIRSATHRLQRAMMEDPPALFLAWNERARAIRRDIVIPQTEGRDLMWTLWNWSRSPSSRTASGE